MKTIKPSFLMPIAAICLLFTSCSGHINAQTETGNNKVVAEKFKDYYNKGQFDDIFNMFSDDMQKHFPVDKTTAFLTDQKNTSGEIATMELDKYQSGYAIYKTKFEDGLWAVKIALDKNEKINSFSIRPYEAPDTFPKIERNTTLLQLPFKGEWTVVWGGDTKELNHHFDSKAQKKAFDILITDKEGKTHKNDGKNNEDYYAFGQEIIAPCDGEVVLAVDGVKDNIPGQENPIYTPGNSILLKTANNEYLLFAHFKQHSIKVKEGQKVKQGELLGLCGNSGNSSEPHLHFHIENIEDMNMATGVKCYFNKIMVNGIVKTDYSPIKGDKVENIKE